MSRSSVRATLGTAIVAGWLVFFGATAPASAGSHKRVPEGTKYGKWILAPYFQFDYSVEDNVFRSSDDENNTTQPESDTISTLTGGVSAYLPIRNSLVILDLNMQKLTYDLHQFTRDKDLEGYAEMQFNFGSFDTLSVSTTYVDGFSDLSELDDIDGGELIFRGEPFTRRRFDVQMQRSVPLRPGYYFRASYIDQRFSGEDVRAFFDYEGWDAALEYRQPLASYKWIVGYFGARKFDHFVPGQSEPFRNEDSETIQLGLRGVAGKEQPFVVRVGWGRFLYSFTEDDPTEFTGVTVFAQWRLAVGGGSNLDLSVLRRPLPSSFDTFYLNTQISADFTRDWGRYSKAGLKLRYDRNTYGDPLEINACGGSFNRDDRRYDAEASVDWRFHKRFGYEMALSRERRDSSCFLFEYTATVVSAGVRVGWF